MVGNTLSGMNLFYDEFLNSIILHIPHSKTLIPQDAINDYVSLDILNNEISLLTDHATDKIFDIKNINKIIFPYSRVFCDVERLNDNEEVMFQYGRGYYYTKTDDGIVLRNENNKDNVYNNYYLKHHDLLTTIVEDKLNENNLCVLVDCHSFSDIPFKTDINQNLNRPDFCIGVDSYHTPEWLYKPFINYLNDNNYSVQINSPYDGTIIPTKFYKKNKSVYGMMIEVNRKLYMKDNNVVHDEVQKLNNLFSNYFS